MVVSDQRDSSPIPRQPFSLPGGLLERDGELAAIEGVIDAAATGGRLLAIEGPPGIGKTSLLSEMRGLGLKAGMRVLSGRGSELERSFSYGVVRQLFEPVLASLSAEERDDSLAGAASLRPRCLTPPRSRPSQRETRRLGRCTGCIG